MLLLHRSLVQWTCRLSRRASWSSPGCAAGNLRDIRMLSRKRNVFLEPSDLEGDTVETLQVCCCLEFGTSVAGQCLTSEALIRNLQSFR